MSVFQHPHLTRGIVQTAKGAFVISRGLVEMPDEIGESLGWRPVDRDDGRSGDTELASQTARRVMSNPTKEDPRTEEPRRI
jgi:hypothetical protein